MARSGPMPSPGWFDSLCQHPRSRQIGQTTLVPLRDRCRCASRPLNLGGELAAAARRCDPIPESTSGALSLFDFPFPAKLSSGFHFGGRTHGLV
jgi:hypothetical protein